MNTFEKIFLLINNIFFPSIRIFFVLYTATFFRNYINFYIKIILSFFCGYIIFLHFPISKLSAFSFSGSIIFLEQIFLGTIIGLSINLIFSIINIAGEILGLQTGLSFFNFFDSTNRTNFPILTRFLNVFLVFVFLLIDGHLWIISIVMKSFYIVPVDLQELNVYVFFSMVQFFGLILISGIQIIFPFVLILLSINLILYLLNKFFPQLAIFSINFPITAISGILLLYILTYYFVFYLRIYCEKMFFLMLNILSQI